MIAFRVFFTEEPFIVDGYTFEDVQSQICAHRSVVNQHLSQVSLVLTILLSRNFPKNNYSCCNFTKVLISCMFAIFFLKLGGPGTRRRIDAVSMLTLSDTSLNYIEELNNEEKNFEPSFSLVINGHSLVCKKTRESESISQNEISIKRFFFNRYTP